MFGAASLAKAWLLALITFAVYLPALRGGFVFDDYPLVAENGMIRADDGIRRFWTGAGTADYYPLTGIGRRGITSSTCWCTPPTPFFSG